MKYIFNSQNVFIYHKSISRGIWELQKLFLSYQNEQKQILPSTPYNPTVADWPIVFRPTHFSTNFFEKCVKLIRSICDAIKQNEPEVKHFWQFLLGYYSSFNLVKIPWRLGHWFSRNIILSDCRNNKNKEIICFAWLYLIFKMIFASSDSFCLIASHILHQIRLSP